MISDSAKYPKRASFAFTATAFQPKFGTYSLLRRLQKGGEKGTESGSLAIAPLLNVELLHTISKNSKKLQLQIILSACQ